MNFKLEALYDTANTYPEKVQVVLSCSEVDGDGDVVFLTVNDPDERFEIKREYLKRAGKFLADSGDVASSVEIAFGAVSFQTRILGDAPVITMIITSTKRRVSVSPAAFFSAVEAI